MTTSPLSEKERAHLSQQLLASLPWLQGAAALTAERYDVATESLLLQVQHNDLRLPDGWSEAQRLCFLDEVMVPRVVEQSLRVLAKPGTPVGIESATATGRLSTQMALNSFHSSGQLHTETLTGVPRLNEIFNATKDIKGPMMVVRLNPQPHWSEARTGFRPGHLCASAQGVPGFHAFHAFKRWTRFWFEHKTLMDFIDLEGRPSILYRPQTFTGMPIPEPYWYPHWRSIYGPMRAQTMPLNEPASTWYTVRIKLNRQMLVQYQVSMCYISQVLQESVLWAKTKKRHGSWTPLVQVIASPDYEATLDIHCRVDHLPPLERIYRKARIHPSCQGTILLNEQKRRLIYLTQVVVYELSQVRLTGIPNLVEINWRQRSDPEALALKKDLSGGGGGGGDQVLSPEQLWEVITRGSALREVMNRPQVHVPSVFTNDAAQTLDVLGIEAVRKLYIQEMKACMGSVDEAMFQTSVDIMMHRGTITPANRFGAHPLDGPLTKASNEMSTQTLLRAALTHQRENLNGVSAATMVGLPIRIGTGLPQIAWDQDAWFEQLKAHQLEEVKDQELKLRVEHTEPVEHNEPVEMVKNHHGLTGLLSKLSLATGRTYTALEVDEV